jgi:hypothetical protein
MEYENERRHTLEAWYNPRVGWLGHLIKDWFSYEWAEGHEVRHVFKTAVGTVHVVSNRADFSRLQAKALVDAAIAGKIVTFDLDALLGNGRN